MGVGLGSDEKLYAYDMATKARVSGKDFDTLQDAGNTGPMGLWSDGETMWVADWYGEKIYAYDMATKERASGRDFNFLKAAGNWAPVGLWSDGTTMWVADPSKGKVFAYDMATAARVLRQGIRCPGSRWQLGREASGPTARPCGFRTRRTARFTPTIRRETRWLPSTTPPAELAGPTAPTG